MYILLATYLLNLYTSDMAMNQKYADHYIRKIPIVQVFDNRQDCEDTLTWLRNTSHAEGQCKKMRHLNILK